MTKKKKEEMPKPAKIDMAAEAVRWKRELAECVGPLNILKAKILAAKIAEYERPKPLFNPHLAKLEELEKERTRQENKIRANPSHPNDKLREVQMHHATLTNSQLEPRVNAVDKCSIHGETRVVDRENAKLYCVKCGDTKNFQSHIFDAKEQEKEDPGSCPFDPRIFNMQKYVAQFEKGHPQASPEVLEQLVLAYSKYHTRDPSKVQRARTSQIIKTIDLPKVFRKCEERLTKEIRADPVPEFTSVEINKLVAQRAHLTASEEKTEPVPKKSYHNQTYIRNFGLANHMPQARLLEHAKTNSTHRKRTRKLESQALQQSKKAKMNNSLCWEIPPFS